MPLLFFLFIAMPIIEVVVLIMVGSEIGVLWTLALIVLTAFIGINMLRYQGVATLNRANWRMQQGQIPAQEMLEGIFLAIGGALLLTPGFITDAIGFLCLIPATRHSLVNFFKRSTVFTANTSRGGSYQSTHNQQGGFQGRQQGDQQGFGSQTDAKGDIIEGELVDPMVDDKKSRD